MSRAAALRLDGARALGALALGIGVAGYVAVVRPLEARIAQAYAALDTAQRTIDTRRAVADALTASSGERARLRAAIARFDLDAERSAGVERFLRFAAAAANRRGTTIRTLQSEASPPARPDADEPAFDEIPLSLTLRGSYAALIATVRDLADAPVAARISIDALAPEDRSPAKSPRLLAAVGVVLLRAPLPPHVRTEPRQT